MDQANAGGQQLFLANLAFPVKRYRAPRPLSPRKSDQLVARCTLVEHRQLVLFNLPRDLVGARARGTLPEPQDERLAAALDAAIRNHAHTHGWPLSSIKRTRAGARVLLGLQDTPGAELLASDAMLLVQLGLPARNLIDVASAAGLLLDDRESAIHSWFGGNIKDLPGPMRAELTEWFEIMMNGSSSPPRRRPRAEITIRGYLRWAMPALTAWAAAGHQSLREITPAEVRAVLPPSGNPRSTMGQGLRSIFKILKERKSLFINPIQRIGTGGHERRDPLPLAVEVIREALDSPDPARAALAALTAFHALRAGDLVGAHLTDIQDGRLQRADHRSVPLAAPVSVRIAAWLDYRTQRWPGSTNPHLFINQRTAGRTEPVGARWLGLTLGMPARVLREDRILHEIEASGGDVRRICDLFGLTVGGALRYLPTEEPVLPTRS